MRLGRCMPAAIQASTSRNSSSTSSACGDLAQHLAVRVDEAGVAAAGDAEVGVPGLPRPVHGAAHHGHLEHLVVAGQPRLDLAGQVEHVDVRAAARRAGDHHRAAVPQAQRPQDLPRDLDLLDRVGGQRDAERVADPVGQQRADPDGALDRAGERRPGLGDAEVQRVGHLLGQPPVGLDHHRHRRRLDRDLELAVVRAAPAAAPPRAPPRPARPPGSLVANWRRWSGSEPELAPIRIGVDGLLRPADDLLDLVVAADVAGVDAHGGDAGVHRPQRQRGVEVDVRDHRQRRAGDDRRQRIGVRAAGHGHPDEVAPRLVQPPDLPERRLDVVGVGRASSTG